jgi:hypothetical protein
MAGHENPPDSGGHISSATKEWVQSRGLSLRTAVNGSVADRRLLPQPLRYKLQEGAAVGTWERKR